MPELRSTLFRPTKTMTIHLFATLDTKGSEAAFVATRLRELGLAVTLVDTGCLGEPTIAADVSRDAFFQIGGFSLTELQQQNDRGAAIAAAAVCAEQFARDVYAQGQLSGVLGLGGSAGTTIGTAAMRALPIG